MLLNRCGKVFFLLVHILKLFTCYVLRYVTHNRVHKEYYGVVEILQGKDVRAACDFRLDWHLRKPRACMAGAVASSLVLDPLGTPMSESNAYLQGAIYTACALKTDASARGACYACKNLDQLLVRSAAQVHRVVQGFSGQQARDVLKKYIDSKLDTDHPLKKHADGVPYKDAGTTGKVKLTKAFKSGRIRSPLSLLVSSSWFR